MNFKYPNLFVIGAMKSATTSLHSILNMHPDIFMSPKKEPMFFSRNEISKKKLLEYLTLFDKVKFEKYIGESSTEYTKRPQYDGVAQNIKAFNPRSRFIYIMRNPFERSLSQYWFQVENGHESRPLSQALCPPSSYIDTSNYAMQLSPYYEIFPHEHIFLCSFEELKNDPENLMKRIFSWLGIKDNYELENLRKQYNRSSDAMIIHNQKTIYKNFHSLMKKSDLIQYLTPELVRPWVRKLIPKSGILDRNSPEFQLEIIKQRKLLRPLFEEYILELKNMTGWTCEEWMSGESAEPDSVGDHPGNSRHHK